MAEEPGENVEEEKNESQNMNNPLEEALCDLTTLQGKLDSFVCSPQWERRKRIVCEQDVDDSVLLIQTLIKDTNEKCSQLVENRKSDGVAISNFDSRLGDCKSGMDSLRHELAYASRCVHDIEENMMMNGSATESDPEINHCAERELEVTIYRLREENARLHSQLSLLRNELHQLRLRQMEQAALASPKISNLPRDFNCNDVLGHRMPGTSNNNTAIMQLQDELTQSREALIAIKQERKHLKEEKCELLQQMKDVYETLEAKETELRDFIRQYEHRMREGDKGLKDLALEKEKADREKEKLSGEMDSMQGRVRGMETDLEEKELMNAKLMKQLQELQGRFLLLTGQRAPNDESPMEHRTPPKSLRTPSIGYSSGASASPATPKDNLLCAIGSNFSTQMSDSVYSPAARRQSAHAFRNNDTVQVSDAEGQLVEVKMRNKGRSRREASSSDRRATARLSRLFGLVTSHSSRSASNSNNRRIPVESATTSSLYNISNNLQDAISNDLNLAEKADKLIEARSMPLVRWKQAHLLAWLELELGMHDNQLRLFADNVKSGKVMLNLTDSDLETCLGGKSWLLKKKLKLAIEECRAPSLCKYPALREVGWQYVVSHLLPSCGLVQFQDTFRAHLVDGRMLNSLTRRQLDKYLGVSKKFHQISIHKAVELLQRFNFDVKALAERRGSSDSSDSSESPSDLLLWSNARMGRWLESIDLDEYLHNLHTSGLHGAMAVLEPSFTADTLANALNIPQSKHIVRKHLHAEFSQLLFQARSQLNKCMVTSRLAKSRDSGSLGRSFIRSYSPAHVHTDVENNDTPRKRGLRSSFGRVFGLRGRPDYSSDISPVRLLTGSKSLPEHPLSPGSRKIVDYECGNNRQVQETKTNGTAGSGQGTMSSSTSDLGSSMERSQHMKNILSTPKVLLQAPVTGHTSASSSGGRCPLSESADSAISVSPAALDSRLSGCSSARDAVLREQIVIKMRSKSTGRFEDWKANRPHSISEFNNARARMPIVSSQSSSYISSGRMPTMGVSCNRGRSRPQSTLETSTNQGYSTDSSTDNRLSPDNDRHDTATDTDRKKMNAITEGDDECESECNLMEHKPIASSKGVWARSDKKLPVAGIQAARERKSRIERNSAVALTNLDLQETDL